MSKPRFGIKDKVKVITPYNGAFYGTIDFVWFEKIKTPEYSVFIEDLGYSFRRVSEVYLQIIRDL